MLQLGSGGLRDGTLALGGMAFAEKSHVCDHTHVLETKTGWQRALLVALSSSLRGCTHTPSWPAMPGGGAELAPAPTNITASAGPLSPGPGPLGVSCLLSALMASGLPSPALCRLLSRLHLLLSLHPITFLLSSGAKAPVVHRHPPSLPSRGLVHFCLSGNPLL